MRIAIIVPCFPPDSHIASTRWARLSRELVERGHSITVVAAAQDGLGNPFKTPQSGEEPPHVEKILRPAWPLSTRLWHLLFLFVMSLFKLPLKLFRKLGSTSVVAGVDKLDTLLTKQVLQVSNRFFFPHISWVWGKSAGRILADYAQSGTKPDVIIASFPLLGSLKAAEVASKKTGIPWIADLRDPISSGVLFNQSYSQRIQEVEKKLLDSASQVWTINKQLAEMLVTENEVAIVSQSFAPIEEGKVPSVNSSRTKTKIVYTGSIHLKSRYPDLFEGLLGLSQEEDLSPVEINYYGSKFERIEVHAGELQKRGIAMVDHGFVSTEDCYSAQRESDLLLVFGWEGPGYKCVYTGKVFDYLATGRPIIAITYEDSALADLIRDTGAGIVLSNKDQMIEFFDKLRDNPSKVLNRLAQERNVPVTSEFSTPRVADKVEYLLKEFCQTI